MTTKAKSKRDDSPADEHREALFAAIQAVNVPLEKALGDGYPVGGDFFEAWEDLVMLAGDICNAVSPNCWRLMGAVDEVCGDVLKYGQPTVNWQDGARYTFQFGYEGPWGKVSRARDDVQTPPEPRVVVRESIKTLDKQRVSPAQICKIYHDDPRFMSAKGVPNPSMIEKVLEGEEAHPKQEIIRRPAGVPTQQRPHLHSLLSLRDRIAQDRRGIEEAEQRELQKASGVVMPPE